MQVMLFVAAEDDDEVLMLEVREVKVSHVEEVFCVLCSTTADVNEES